MSHKSTITELDKNGYAVCNVENLKIFKAMRNSFIRNIRISNLKKKLLTT